MPPLLFGRSLSWPEVERLCRHPGRKGYAFPSHFLNSFPEAEPQENTLGSVIGEHRLTAR